MNEAGANALYDAEREGVRQIKGTLFGHDQGMCALGVLHRSGLYYQALDTYRETNTCPLCGETSDPRTGIFRSFSCEAALIAHLNDAHDLSFSEIARKLGPDAA